MTDLAILGGGILLGAIPAIVYFALRSKGRRHLWLATGAAFGAVICPWSEALYGLYFAHPLGLVPGLIGLMSTLVHGAIPYSLAIDLGILDPRTVVTDEQSPPLHAIAAFIWAPVYGGVGAYADRRAMRSANAT
jgi:hypothetical protein